MIKKKEKSVREKQFPKRKSELKSDCDIKGEIWITNAFQPNKSVLWPWS